MNARILGLPVRFKRRSYGRAWFCWVHVQLAGEWVSLGDPWQDTTPPKQELEREIRRLTGQPCSA